MIKVQNVPLAEIGLAISWLSEYATDTLLRYKSRRKTKHSIK